MTINVTHSAPVANDDTFTVARNSPGTPLDVLANDTVTAPATIVKTNFPPNNPSPRILSAPSMGGTLLVLAERHDTVPARRRTSRVPRASGTDSGTA